MQEGRDKHPFVKARHLPSHVDAALLQRCMTRVHDVVVDPSLWPEILTEVSEAAGAVGAILLRHEDNPRNVPRSPSINEGVENYFVHSWHLHDIRMRGIAMILQGHVIGDDNITTAEEIDRHGYYNDMLRPFGLRWFAGIGFNAGQDRWCLSIQRGLHATIFSSAEKLILAKAAQALTQAATLSKITGQVALDGFMSGLRMVDQPALLVSRLGTVIEINRQADRLLGEHLFVRNHRLGSSVPAIGRDLGAFMDRLQLIDRLHAGSMRPLVIPRRNRRPLLMRASAIMGAARSPFIGADAILLLTDLDTDRSASSELLKSVYRLTPAEVRLVTRLGFGANLPHLAEELGVSPETLRNQLKSILAKTDTHSQAELIRVVTRLPFSATP